MSDFNGPNVFQTFQPQAGDATGYIRDQIELDNDSDDRPQDDPSGLSLGHSDDGMDTAQRESGWYAGNFVAYTPEQINSVLVRLMYRLGGDNPMPVRNQATERWLANEFYIAPNVVTQLCGEDHLRRAITISLPSTAAGSVYISPYPSVPLGGSGSYLLVPGGSVTLQHGLPVYATTPGASVTTITNVVVPASTPTVVIPAGTVGPVTVTNVGAGGMQFNMGAVVLTSGAAVGQSYYFPPGYVIPNNVTAYDGSASTALVQGTSLSGGVLLETSVERYRDEKIGSE